MDDWLRIGDVARRTGLTHRTLRHWDDLGLLVPSGRSHGDFRLYSAADLRRLLAIVHLRSIGLSLREVAAALDDPSFDAADALARHVAVVEERLASERDLLTRLRGLQRAAEAGWDEVLDVIALAQRLRHPNASVRFRAALAAPASAPLEHLLELLGDPEPGVREAATWAVVQHGDDAVRAVLARLPDPDADVRLQLAHVLGKLAAPTAVPPLARLLDDPDEPVATKAAFALGRIGGAPALDALVSVLGRRSPTFADAVTTALGRFGPDAVAPLVAALGDADPATREHAAETLGYRGDEQATSALAAALGDPDAGVRLASLLSLGALRNDEAGRAIAGVVDSRDERTRLVARRLLADRQAG